MNTSDTFATVVLVFVIIIIIHIPIVTIYAMNHLFAMGWVVDFPTWFSVFWLQLIVAGGAAASKRSKK